MYLKGCCNYVLHEIESTSMKGSIESAVWCIWYRCLVVHGHPTQSNTESTIVGVWAVVPWQWFVTEEPSVENNHTEESRMTYTPSHNSCTASVILCKHALPHACLLYSHACVSVYCECRQACIWILSAGWPTPQHITAALHLSCCACVCGSFHIWFIRSR